MMLVPRRDNSFDLFDDFFKDDFFTKRQPNLMKTDIKEKKDKYVIEMDLPGYEKENINIALEEGYLKISASVVNEENSDEDEKFVRRERYFGECSRSFYVGDELDEDDIRAKFKNGTLSIEIPKKEEVKELPKAKTIEIE